MLTKNTRTRHPEQSKLSTVSFRTLKISILASLIGIGVGFVAYCLYHLIGFFTNLFLFQRISWAFTSARMNPLGLWVIIIPVIGGLIVGIIAKYGSPKIKGHGIPEAMEAVLVNRSRIEPKVAILKPLSAAIAIGTGGPFGAEGPIIQTGGAVGSLVGQILQTTAAERKVLLASGAGAGMAATFNTPLAGVILAIELLLFEFEVRSFIPLVIASTLATSVHFQLLGPGPMFDVGAMTFRIPYELPFYILLGPICGLAAVVFTKALYWVDDQFEHLPVNDMWWPAIGGLGVGIIGFFVPRVLGVGYDTISDILNNRLSLGLLLVIMLCKFLALIISLGSGTSGGLLAPMFMSSAAMGAVFAQCLNWISPNLHLVPSSYALIAMGAVFGAASHAPFTFIIFAFEVTRNYNAVIPLMLVSVIAEGIAIRFMKESIMTQKLSRRGLHVRHEYEVDILRQVTVDKVMSKSIPTIPSNMKVSELAEQITRGNSQIARYQAVLIVDQENCLMGIISRGDLLRALEQNAAGDMTVLEAGSQDLVVTYPDELVYEAVIKLLRNNIGRLPVVSRKDPRHLVGYLGRSGILATWMRRLEEEQILEPGWLSRR
jgi:H+/Cl- antiporter ClcA